MGCNIVLQPFLKLIYHNFIKTRIEYRIKNDIIIIVYIRHRRIIVDIFLARQPIFDNMQRVYAYEILYRSGQVNVYDGIEEDKASIDVITNTFQTFGIDNLTNRKPVFINFTENLIYKEIATLIPKELLVVEILESIIPTKKVIKKCRDLKRMGYKIALDDFVDSIEYKPMVILADIIKIDFMNTSKDEISKIIRAYKRLNIEFLAEKVETREDFEFAKKMGFKYFQGYFFSKPEIMQSKKILPIKANYLQLINEINKEEISFSKIADIISRDLSLSYNFLKLVNSVAFGIRYKVTGIRQGLVLIGKKEIKRWIYLTLLNDMGSEGPDELTKISLIRARFMELVSKETHYRYYSEDMFIIGLFSLLDVILKKPLKEILYETQTSDIVKEGLLNEDNDINNIYKLILSYEKGQWDQVVLHSNMLNMDMKILTSSYFDSIKWYNDLVS